MQPDNYFILAQIYCLLLLIICPSWILCTGKKKVNPSSTSSVSAQQSGRSQKKRSLEPMSAIKPITEPSASVMGQVKNDVKKEEPKNEEKKPGDENKNPAAVGAEGAGAAEKPQDKSQKPFPEIKMPTESMKKKKNTDNEIDKRKKMKTGFYQEKSDEDDTLEKIESLKVEQSDKTKKSQKKKLTLENGEKKV